MRLYIRNHPDELVQPWWDRFEATLVPQYIGPKGLEKLLDAHGAVLQWDKDTGLPYLKFNDEKDLSWFILKWS